MESARLPHPSALPGAIQTVLVLGMLLLAGLAWALSDELMGGMDAGPGTALGSLGFWVVTWVVMMAAMMFPSVAPMVVVHARVHAGRRRRDEAVPGGATVLFVGGYLMTWATAGVVGYAVVEGGRALDLEALGWDRAGPYLAGGVIVAAAVYQLTPLKDACLRRCRSPLTFLMTAWRPGRTGALRMGVEHGGWCVGCCWALMAALFALGAMSIGWMAFVAALIAIEKLVPWKAAANRGIAVLLVALGLAVALVPEDVPGLTVPGTPEAMQSMEGESMEGESMRGGAAGEGGAMEEGSP
jgi:predicted metal-binding membrane protein